MINLNSNSLKNLPDHSGRFGQFGGRFVAETLMPLILSVEEAYEKASEDKLKFIQKGLKDYSSQRNYDFGPNSRENTSI